MNDMNDMNDIVIVAYFVRLLFRLSYSVCRLPQHHL
jgi:hypothetical protein